MFTTLPQVLQLIGNTPHLHTMKVFAEKLKVTKALMGGGDMSGMLKDVMENGIGQLLQNPLGGLLGQAKGLIGQMGGMLDADSFPKLLKSLGAPAKGGTTGAESLGTAPYDGLSVAIDNLSDYTDGVSGVREGGVTMFDVVSHVNTIGMIGGEVPEAVSLTTVLAPIYMHDDLNQMMVDVNEIVLDAVEGRLTDEEAADQIDVWTGILTTSVDNATNALAYTHNAAHAIASACVATACLSLDKPELTEAVSLMMGQERADAIIAAQDQFFAVARDKGDD